MASSFEEMLAKMEQQLRQEQEAFATDEENPKRIKVVNPEKLLNRPLTPIEEEMLHNIANVDHYSWNRSKEGGIITGFPLFDEAIERDLAPGLILVAASPNVGKTAFTLQLLHQISQHNENAFCDFLLLDDGLKEVIPRFIAYDQMITITQAKMPERFIDDEEIIQKRNEGLKNLYRNIDRFVLRDETTSGSSVEKLEDRIKQLRMTYPEKRIILGIDSFYDLTTEKTFTNEKSMVAHVSQTLKNYCKDYEVTIICTAHLRKTNGHRPTTDDLKENNRLEFDANLILLLYNEVGIKEESASVYWLDEEEEAKMPVLEVRFGKNKYGSFKGHRFYEMIPKQSRFIEASIESSKHYASLIYG